MVLGLWLAPAPADEPAAQLCDLAVHSDQLEYDHFEAVASVRLAGVRLRLATQQGDASCRGQVHGYVELHLQAPGRWQLSLITSDGRAWYRSADADADDAPRVLASLLANLLAAIADASVEADARDVSLPAELIESSETDDTLAPGGINEPTPEPTAPADHTNERPATAAPRGEILLELGPRATGSMLVGLAPGPGLRGGGGGLGLDLRLPDGLAFGLDLRALTATAMEVSLTRVRVALGLGFVSRSVVGRGVFELPVLISGIVEPWFARRSGAGVPFAQPPMIGGGLRVAPGLLVEGDRIRVRVGLAIGLEIAIEAAAGALTPAIAFTPTSKPILRAGGVELSAAVELGLWIPVRARL
jgi:hypothetical protein